MEFKVGDIVMHLAERIFYGRIMDITKRDGRDIVYIRWEHSGIDSSYWWTGTIFQRNTARLCGGVSL
jgi:hypothetical protein